MKHARAEKTCFTSRTVYSRLLSLESSQELILLGVRNISLSLSLFFLVFVSGKRIKFLGSRQIVLGLMRLGDTSTAQTQT
jgi:hypothetical protein